MKIKTRVRRMVNPASVRRMITRDERLKRLEEEPDWEEELLRSLDEAIATPRPETEPPGFQLPRDQFKPGKIVAIDTETTGVDVWGAHDVDGVMCVDKPFAVSMCDEEGHTWYCAWEVNPFTREVTPNPADVEYIISVLSTPGIQAIFHNSKFDCRMLAKVGIFVEFLVKLAGGRIHDTLFQARVCNTLELDYGLKPLSKRILDIDDIDEKQLQEAVVSARRRLKSYNVRAIKNNMPLMLSSEEPKTDYWLPAYFAKLDLEQEQEPNTLWLEGCKRYCRFDTFRTMGLHLFYHDVMSDDDYLREKYDFEMRSIWPIVNKMEERGMRAFPDENRIETQNCLEAMGYFHDNPELCEVMGCAKPKDHEGPHSHLANMQSIIEEHGLLHLPPEKMAPPETKRPRKIEWKPPPFNPSSSPQLMRVLYLPKGEGGLGIPHQFKRKGVGKGEKLTADKDTLRDLMYEPFVQELAGYRAAKHTKGLFFDKFEGLMKPDLIVRDCWVIHPGLNQCGTKTGRFSCNDPNLQQVSAGGKKSLSATYSSTKVFGPRPGYVWLGFDYSQQEVRIFAFLAQVPVMLEAISTGADPFKAMADKAWGGKLNKNTAKAVVQALDLFRDPANDAVKDYWNEIGWSKVKALRHSPSDSTVYDIAQDWIAKHGYSIVAAEASLGKESSRQRCKHITYAKIFGGGPESYTHLLYCTLDETREFDEEYNASMPEMKEFMDRLGKKGGRDRYIINLYGRKLCVDPQFRYRAVSYMVQGSAADMMKNALVKVDAFLSRLKNCDAHLIITIHDELKIEIREKHLTDNIIQSIIARMEDTEGRVGVPMPVECTVTKHRWGVEEEKWKPGKYALAA
jgi:DNA polymerase I-like protein with 3'-5' exonuclease and polymerase domains